MLGRLVTSSLAAAPWLLVGSIAAAQAPFGKEAAVPKPEAPPTAFRSDHEGGVSFSFLDGDPSAADAPRVIAIAGGGRIWFGDYFLTARNILIWVDGDVGGAKPPTPAFPYAPSDPVTAGAGVLTPALSDLKGASLFPGIDEIGVTPGRLREIYAEGDVYIEQQVATSKNVFQAAKAYFNIIEDRSLIVNGEVRTDMGAASSIAGAKQNAAASTTEPQAPIVFRAAEIRGVAKGLLEANNAELTTCTFAEPGYHVAVDRLIYEQRANEISGRATGIGNELFVHQQPLVALPYLEVRTGAESPFPLIGLRIGGSSKLGFFIKTRWGNVFEQAGVDFNNWLGVEGEFEGKWYVDINLYSKRGLGLGGGLEYETKSPKDAAGGRSATLYEGKTDIFFVNDISGDDETGENRDTDYSGLRGRFRTLNRIFLPEDWRLDTEINYVSDENVIREFFEDDSELRREPETVAYLRKLDGDTATTSTLRYRLNTWQTQTEYLPQATYDVISRPIAEFSSLGDALGRPDALRLYWTHRSEVAFVNRLVSDELDDDDFDELKSDEELEEEAQDDEDEEDPDASPLTKKSKHGKKPPSVAKASGDDRDDDTLDDDIDQTKKQELKSNDPFLDARERQYRAEGTAIRIDNIDRFSLPFELGPVELDPYFENRATMWLGDAEIDGGGGGLREGMTIGFNASTQFWRTLPDVESEFWNIHGIRHIVIPSLRYRYTFLSTKDSNDLVPYDSVERFDTLHAIVPGVRSRYQTKRMTRYGRSTVTFLDIDVQQPFVFENGRQEDLADILEDEQGNDQLNENEEIDDGTGLADFWLDIRYKPDIAHYLFQKSYVRSTFAWNWQESQVDRFGIEFETEPGPDFMFRAGYSYAQAGAVSPTLALDGFLLNRESDRNLNEIRLEVAYQVTRRWEIAVRNEIEIPTTGVGDLRVILRRRTHDWLFDIDVGALGGGSGFGVSVTPLAFAKRDGRDRFKSALSDGYDMTPLFESEEYSEGPALTDGATAGEP